MTTYYPILRNSTAEIEALSKFYTHKNAVVDKVFPIIELKQVSFSKETPPKFNTTGSYLKKKLGNHKLILQFSTTFSDETELELAKNWKHPMLGNPIETIQHYLTASNINYYPCITANEPSWILDSLKTLNYKKLFVRVNNNYLNSNQKNNLDKIVTNIKSQFPNVSLTVILDYYNNLPELNDLVSLSKYLFQKDVGVIFCGTSCPENADGYPSGDITVGNKRHELSLFQNAQKKLPYLNFSDYTVRLKPKPIFKKDKGFNSNNTYFKLFYTTSDSYVIAKSDLRSKLDDPEKINSSGICRLIVNSGYFTSSDYSWGDNFISHCAKEDIEFQINDHRKPIAIGINHHLHITQNQL
ncbi:hypothetical protein ACDJ35_11930 [Enterococcus faecalis]|uniref:beta family protein n=1 Tax=Enterococcus faecalis TaxID=1351 RepID=UPI003F5FAF23